MAARILTAEALREILHYDPETGAFFWKETRGTARAGALAGCLKGDGYRLIKVCGRQHYAHRLAWLYVYAVWPKDQIDHINGYRDDNRISNLREATSSENGQNIGLSDRNTSGYLGVTWAPRTKKWRAQITLNGKTAYVGYAETPKEAYEIYLAAKRKLHYFQPIPRRG